MLGRLSASYGDDVLADVLAAAIIEKPLDPKSWVTAGCEARAKAKSLAGKANGRTDDLALLNRDPRPKWLEPTGFDNIFEAENDGCYQHTAHLFRDGKRVAA